MENRLNDASRPIHKHNSLYTKEGLHFTPSHMALRLSMPTSSNAYGYASGSTGYGVSNWTSTPLEGSSIGSDANAASSWGC